MRPLFALAIIFALSSTVQAQEYYYQDGQVLPLRTNYYFDVSDNVSNTENGIVDNYASTQRQYQYEDVDGFIFSEGHRSVQNDQSQFTLFSLYYDDTTKDYVAITDAKEDYVIADGSNYQFVKNLGYLYKNAAKNTTPVYLFWSDRRKDYMTASLDVARASAKRAGYKELAIIGHILYPAAVEVYFQGYRMTPLYSRYYPESQDHVTNTNGGYSEYRKYEESVPYEGIEGYVIAEIDGELFDDTELLPVALFFDTKRGKHRIFRNSQRSRNSEFLEYIETIGYLFLKDLPNTKPLQVIHKSNDWFYAVQESSLNAAKEMGYRDYISQLGRVLVLD